MRTMRDTHAGDEVIAALARCAPTAASVAREWTPAGADVTLAGIVGTAHENARETDESYEIPLQFVPSGAGTRRHRRVNRMSVAASVAALATVAAAFVVVVTSGRSSSDAPAGAMGPAFTPPSGLSNQALDPGQYSYRVNQQIDLGAEGTPTPNGADDMIDRSWVAPNGDIVSARTGIQNGCSTFPHSGTGDFTEPTQDFFAALPTDVDALTSYLRSRVGGSSSHDEAVFVAVGDALHTADGLASPQLRAAFVAVLSRTPGVIVHQNQHDYLGRAALRADFVDQRIRPGEVQSLYFDPTTFQLLEQRDGSNAEPDTYDGPSPGYDEHAGSAADDPDELTGPAFVAVMTSEQVVDTLPQSAQGCPNG